jgi:hypothetical protein
MAAFRNPAASDYRLVSGSVYVNASLDGRDIGCNMAALPAFNIRPTSPVGVRITQR